MSKSTRKEIVRMLGFLTVLAIVSIAVAGGIIWWYFRDVFEVVVNYY